MAENTMEFLENVSLFMDLTREEMNQIAEIIEEEQYEQSSVVIAEGVPGDALYIVLDGEVVIEKIFYEEKVVIATLKTGAIFGEMSLVDNYPTSATVSTTKNSTLLVLYQTKLKHLIDKDGIFAAKFWKSLSRILCNRIRSGNESLREYFIINRAAFSNPQFRELYAISHGASVK